jgi:DNA-binding SARP family transcriptional activator
VKVSVHAERLLALLAIRPGTHRRSWAAGVLWPELPQSQAKAKLRSVIWRLPETHRPHVLRLTDGTIALADDVPVDLHESIQAAEWLVDSSLRLDAEQLHGMPLDGLTQDLLPHLCDEQWLMTDQERFRQLRLHALEALCYRLAEIRAYSAALNAGLEAVCADPLRESARRAVIQVFLLEGNRSDAVRQLESYRKVLRKELGIAPSPELTRLLGGALVTSASPGGRPGVNGILAARERAAGGLRLPGAAR